MPEGKLITLIRAHSITNPVTTLTVEVDVKLKGQEYLNTIILTNLGMDIIHPDFIRISKLKTNPDIQF
jgi:hypothetical protein